MNGFADRTVIVGGGVIGLATAYFLSRWGLPVTVVERGRAGREASFAAAGMLAVGCETERPGPFFVLSQSSRALYARWAAALERQTGVDVEYQASGIVEVAHDPAEAERLRAQIEWQRAFGLAAEWLSADELRRRLPALARSACGAAFYPGDGQVNNRQLAVALREACLRQGVDLREETEVIGWLTDSDPRGDRRVRGVVTSVGEIAARWTVLAAGAWSRLLARQLDIDLPVRPVKGQIVEARVRAPYAHIVYAGKVYLVPKPGGRLLIGATQEEAGFDRRPTLGAASRLLDAAQAAAPALEESEWVDTWAGLRPGTPDGWPILGPAPQWQGLLLATGHFRNGILLAPITGLITAQRIAGRPLAVNWRPFSLDRFGRAGEGRPHEEDRAAGEPRPGREEPT
ncbi:MAG TPA: glycine oxidase ThiO, partial [Limnochordia bacterium]